MAADRSQGHALYGRLTAASFRTPFEFVVTAGARARQLLAGSTPRVAVGEHKKTTVAHAGSASPASVEKRSPARPRIGRRRRVGGLSDADRARRDRRHRRLQGGRGRARPAEARPRRRRDHDARRRPASSARSPSRRSPAAASSPISSRPGANADIEHIALASTIDLLLIAPATANVIGKLANGIADDFLTTLYTATRAPVLIAPAMNTQMFAHDAGAPEPGRRWRRAASASSSRARAIWPAAGSARAGWPSRTRSSPRPTRCCGRDGPLRGATVLVTAGPTLRRHRPGALRRQSIERTHGICDCGAKPRDAVREVTLVAGPTSVDAACGATRGARARRRGDARGGHGAGGGRGRRRHGGGGRRLHAGRRRADRRSPKAGGDADAGAEAHARHPRRSRPAAPGRRAAVPC